MPERDYAFRLSPDVRPLGIYHMAGHYGNMIIYMRELGHLPPSTGHLSGPILWRYGASIELRPVAVPPGSEAL